MPLGSYTSAAFTTATGVAVAANADVEVRRESDSALASIFSDRAGATPISQPGFQADSEGRFVFYAAGISGGYQVKVTKGAETYTARYQATGTARELDADAFWATVWPAATKAAARLALGFGAATDAKVLIGEGSDFIPVPAPMGFSVLNGYLDWTVAGNALTAAIKTWAGADPSAADPVYIAFRDPTAATGLPLIRKLTAATSVTASSGSTLGTINSTAFRLWCVAFDDGGTVRLGLINCLSGTAPNFSIYPLGAWPIASSTAEGGAGAADSAAVFYTGTAVTSKAYAVLGYATWESGLAAAGTWSAGPDRKQLHGPGVPLPGTRVTEVHSQTATRTTSNSAIPFDNTIPQNTEGVELQTATINISSKANITRSRFSASGTNNTGVASTCAIALFRDSVANALAASSGVSTDGGRVSPFAFEFSERAPASGTVTYKLRFGPSSAAGSGWAINGGPTTNHFGGVDYSQLAVEEVMA